MDDSFHALVMRGVLSGRTKASRRFVAYFFVLSYLLVCTSFSVNDQLDHGQIEVYVFSTMLIGALFYIPPFFSSLFFAPTLVYFGAGMYLVQPDANLAHNNMVNGAIATIMAFILSNIIYSMKLKEYVNLREIEHQKLLVEKTEAALQIEHKKAERLLHNLLPVPIADRLKSSNQIIADRFQNASILFADIVGFTLISDSISPEMLVNMLNDVFTLFDDLADKHGVEKIKTIGDAYMAASGIPLVRKDHAEATADMALDMMKAVEGINSSGKGSLRIRIGIHSGPVVAGVIGKRKFSYDLWGDSVNTAARMEFHGAPGEIQVTSDTYELLKDKYLFTDRGMVEVKGKGPMQTYFLKDKIM